MLPELLAWRWTTTPPVDEVVTGAMRLVMTFWNSAASKRPPFHVAVPPSSSCWAVSGTKPGLPKIVVPIGVVVKLAPSSVAVGARKPLDAPNRPLSQSVILSVAPTE